MGAANYIFWYPVNHKLGFNLPKANTTGRWRWISVNNGFCQEVAAARVFDMRPKYEMFFLLSSPMPICSLAAKSWEERKRKVWTFVLKWAINQSRLLAATQKPSNDSDFFKKNLKILEQTPTFWQVNRAWAWGTKSNPLEAWPSLADCQFCQMRW